ncbi:cytochrome P450 2F3-like isoform X2 [Eubalaena glacialis]|uniref:cytochrome P450 2F3-like isoform X2 n=1 Tax=Eubalaena glacialis TaxID=27606 RepID=UPI002A59D99F|nr:cytochrome P450 2F3-like isoform X2 [Eubalaena glacialis]
MCSYAALRDALVLQADAFSGRGARAVFERFTRGNGIVVSNGQRWRTLRNFALGALQEFGLGTRTIRDSVLEEAPCLLGEFQDSVGAPFDPWRLLDNAVSHVMCSVVFENRYGYEDPEFLRFLDLFNDNFRIMSSRWGEEQKGPESHFQETLVMMTHNHFLGSTETTSTALRYELLFLLKHPEVAGL